nr:DUF6134 family protein [uncultured Rhodopila sp.]
MLLSGAVAAARQAAAALPVPRADRLEFRIIRHGSEIGRHTVTFESRGESLTVRVTVDALVTLLSLPIVRYAHRATETWQGDALIGVSAETDKNGRHQWASARRTNEGLVVLGSQTQRYIAPEPAATTSYWDKRALARPMISLEDGVLLRPKVAEHKADIVPTASGGPAVADHYVLSGAFDVELWYDRSDTWASLAYSAPDGSTVHYERL